MSRQCVAARTGLSSIVTVALLRCCVASAGNALQSGPIWYLQLQFLARWLFDWDLAGPVAMAAPYEVLYMLYMTTTELVPHNPARLPFCRQRVAELEVERARQTELGYMQEQEHPRMEIDEAMLVEMENLRSRVAQLQRQQATTELSDAELEEL